MHQHTLLLLIAYVDVNTVLDEAMIGLLLDEVLLRDEEDHDAHLFVIEGEVEVRVCTHPYVQHGRVLERGEVLLEAHGEGRVHCRVVEVRVTTPLQQGLREREEVLLSSVVEW
jgi:hypothetical protein